MKVVAVIGSAREDSRSSKVLNNMIKGAKDAGNEVVIFNLNKIELNGCQGCRTCRTNGSDCIIEDGLKNYFDEIHTAGALLVSAPNYYSMLSGQMIEFMNRHYCLSDDKKNSRLKQTVKLCMVFSQGAPENYDKCQNIYDWYISTFTGKNFVLKSKLIVGGDSNLSFDGKIMTDAYNAGKNL